MKRIIFILLVLFSVTACQQVEPTASNETSPGGIKYSLIQMSDVEHVVVQVAWPTDWSFRTDTKVDVPYIAAQLILAGGAEGYPAGQVGERFADMQAEGNLSAGPEFVFGYLKFKKTNEAEAIKIANAHLGKPSLEQAWLDRVRDGIVSNMAEAKTKPDQQLFDAMRWALLGSHPLREYYQSSTGADINLVTRADVQQWVGEVLTRKPKAIVLAGALTPEEAGSMVDRLFEGLPEPTRTLNVSVTANFSPRKILLHAPQFSTSQMIFAAPLPPSRLGYDFEDIFLNENLGSGESSVLFKAVRTELRASYSFASGIDSYAQSLRFLFMNGEVDTPKMAETEKAVRLAYQGFRQSGVKNDIGLSKTQYLENIKANRLKPEAVSYIALQAMLDDQPAARALGIDKEVEALTAEAVNARLAKSFPKADDFLVVAISPDANALPGACVITRPEDAVNCR